MTYKIKLFIFLIFFGFSFHNVKAMMIEANEKGTQTVKILPQWLWWEPDTSELSRITPNSLRQIPPRIAVLENPLHKGQERMLADITFLADLVTKTCMNNFGFPTLSKYIHDPIIFSRVLEEEGYLNARKVHGFQLMPIPENWEKLPFEKQLSLQYREIISYSDIELFKDPAIVYELKEFHEELVLAPVITFPQDLRKKWEAVLNK